MSKNDSSLLLLCIFVFCFLIFVYFCLLVFDCLLSLFSIVGLFYCFVPLFSVFNIVLYLCFLLFYAPNFEKVEGVYCFRLVHPSVHLSVCPSVHYKFKIWF